MTYYIQMYGDQLPCVLGQAIGIMCFSLMFIPDMSLYHLVNKSQVFLAFIQYKAMIKLKIGYKNKALQIDNGKEYLFDAFILANQWHST